MMRLYIYMHIYIQIYIQMQKHVILHSNFNAFSNAKYDRWSDMLLLV